jgi:hypothetical protein
MRKAVLSALFIVSVFLGGCIVSTSPASPIITMDVGDSVDFKAVVFPAWCDVQWTLKYIGIDEDIDYGLKYTFTPEKKGLYQMNLDVTQPSGSHETRIWVIYVEQP